MWKVYEIGENGEFIDKGTAPPDVIEMMETTRQVERRQRLLAQSDAVRRKFASMVKRSDRPGLEQYFSEWYNISPEIASLNLPTLVEEEIGTLKLPRMLRKLVSRLAPN